METNRAFLYGDGLFETMRVHRGRLLWAEAHAARLQQGLQALSLVLDQGPVTADWLQEQAVQAQPDQSAANYRVRGTFFRRGGGLYTPQEQGCAYHFESRALAADPYPFPDQGLQLGIAQSIQLPTNSLSPHKTLNALPYVLAGIEKTQRGWQDILLLNTNGHLAEAQAANLFVVQGETIYTPALDQGCIAGVLRQQVLAACQALGWAVVEAVLPLSMLAQAQELWLTNAIQGIAWAAHVEGYSPVYSPSRALILHDYLCRYVVV